MALTEEEMQRGYKLYQGFFYYEGGQKYLYDTDSERIYALPQLIGALMPKDFYDGFSTGDTVRIKGFEKELLGKYELQGKQIALVYEGDASSIPEDVMAKLVERDAPYHEG